MVALKTVFLVVAAISFVTFVALFGRLPALRKTPIAFLHRVLWVHLPNGVRKIDRFCTGGRLSAGSARLTDYLLHERHPVVLILFLGLLTGSAFLFLRATYHDLSRHQLSLTFFLLLLPYVFSYLCASSTSQFVSEANHEENMHQYPYDYILYRPRQKCRTCNFYKPARSKHCSICKRCVTRCDHHCVWVNICLGKGNYRWFLALLLSLTAILAWGTWLAWVVLLPSLPSWRGVGGSSLQRLTATLEAAVNKGGISITGVGLLALLTSPLPFALFLYHMYLVWAGMTTNESNKWSDWREDMHDGVVFKGDRRVLWKNTDHDQADYEGEPKVQWPVVNSQIIIRTENGQQPPGNAGRWTRCWRLEEVENIYDLGFWDNLMEMVTN